MSIFRREPEPAQKPTPPTSRTAPSRSTAPVTTSPERTHIARGSKLVGEVSGKAELVIDGMVEGKIHLDSRVVVGDQGEVRGEIVARAVQIGGKVVGNVRGHERVEILASGRLEGDVVAPQKGVHIAEGAFFAGKVEMGRSDAKEGAAKTPPVKSSGGAGGTGDRADSGKASQQGSSQHGSSQHGSSRQGSSAKGQPQGGSSSDPRPSSPQGKQGRSGK